MNNPFRKSTLVLSRKDPASMTMLKKLKKRQNFDNIEENSRYSRLQSKNMTMIVLDEEMIYCDNIEDIEDSDRFVFLSRHVSQSKKPTLTSHFLGNPSNEAPYGGEKMQIAATCPELMKNYMINLYKQKNNLLNYEISLEATHHGPTSISKPCIFIEIGSEIKQWQDENAAEIVIKSVINSIENQIDVKKVGIGLGGPHYSKKFTELLINTEYAIAGYISRHYMEYFNQEILEQMIEKCEQEINYAIIDKKGIGKERKRVLEILQENELKIISI